MAVARRQSYEGVAVAVPVTVPYRRYATQGAHWFLGQAVRRLVEVSGVDQRDIDGLTVSSFSLGPDTAVGVTQHLGLSPRWLDHIPTGGASGVMALRRAARAVQAGDANIVACVAADTNHVDSFRQTLGGFSHFARDATYPYGAGGPNSVFAMITAHYMRTYGAQREDFGRIAVSQRTNALRNPNALFKKPLTLGEYMGAKAVSDPLHLFDCVMPCAGADAFLVMTEERARDLFLAMWIPDLFMKVRSDGKSPIDATVRREITGSLTARRARRVGPVRRWRRPGAPGPCPRRSHRPGPVRRRAPSSWRG